MAFDPGEHIEDLDPRGPDFDLDKPVGERKLRAAPSLKCLVCGTVHVPTQSLALTFTNVTQVPASPANYTNGRLGYGVNGIIIHTIVGSLASADGAFQSAARGASAHYGIPYNGYADSPIHQYVGEGNTAWHCGRFYPDAANPLANTNTIGIEHADNGAYNSPRPDGLYVVTSQQVKDDCLRFGIPIDRAHIRKHKEVSVLATACPDSLDIDRIVAMAAGTYGPIPVPITSTEEDMIYIGPTHSKPASIRVFTAGSAYRERSASSPAATALAAGAMVTVSGYCYSSSPVQSADLGGGVAGPDYVWWQAGSNWVPDAILDTSTVPGAPAPAVPAAEPMNLLFALAGSGGGAGTPGPKGDQGIPGSPGPKGDKGDAGVVPDHHHNVVSTGPMVP